MTGGDDDNKELEDNDNDDEVKMHKMKRVMTELLKMGGEDVKEEENDNEKVEDDIMAIL